MRKLSSQLHSELERYLLAHYHGDEDLIIGEDCSAPRAAAPAPIGFAGARKESAPAPMRPMMAAVPDLDAALRQLDESFQEALLRLIDERGIKDSTCYKRAGVDRKLFSKIRSNPQYKPKKTTAVAFAIALELSLSQANDLLRKAGYTLSHSSKFDVIVEFFIVQRRYNIQELNEALYAYDQPLLS